MIVECDVIACCVEMLIVIYTSTNDGLNTKRLTVLVIKHIVTHKAYTWVVMVRQIVIQHTAF